MPSIFSLLLGRNPSPEERMTVDQWAEKYFSYNGLQYPMVGQSYQQNSESAPNDFFGYVQTLYKSNGVVFACMMARMQVFSEARFTFQRMRGGRPTDVFGTPDLDLLDVPWPNGTTGELLSRAIQDVDLAGNHYVVREGNRLRRLCPEYVEIVLTHPPDESVQSDVAGYLYRPGGTQDQDKWELYPPEFVAHWAPVPDPEAQYRGMSWLTPVIREVLADKSATLHKLKFFENAATPNLTVSLKETVTEEQFAKFMKAMDSAHGGVENAYKTMFLGGGADVTVVGADFRQMDFKVTQGAGETRIAAAARVHPVIVGLSEGMQGSSLNAGNFRSAKDAFGDGTLRPLWRSICAAYSNLIPVPSDARLWYDDRDIAFLRTDRAELVDIHAKQAQTIIGLVRDGFTHESAVAAVLADGDWSLLEHTGLFSVQLQPPWNGETGEPHSNDTDGDGKPDKPKPPPPPPAPASGGPKAAAPQNKSPKAEDAKPAAAKGSAPKPKQE